MWEGLWSLLLCNNSECSTGFLALTNPDSCINNTLVIAADILLLFILFCMLIYKTFSKKIIAPPHSTFSPVSIISATFNAALALAYFSFGVWTINKKVNTDQTITPLHGCLVFLCQGFTWLLLAFTISLKKPNPSHISITKVCSILAFLIAVFLCSSAIWQAFVIGAISVKIVLNICFFPGSILLLFSAFQDTKGDTQTHDDAFYTPLQGAESDIKDDISSNGNVTPFEKAGLFSTMTFWWLNPLMKKGKQKILEDEDIPVLRQADRARTWYLKFMEQLNKRKEGGSSDTPSILSIVFYCQRREFFISGLYALIKILTTTSSPLFLMAFIKIVEGNAAFKYEGYALTDRGESTLLPVNQEINP